MDIVKDLQKIYLHQNLRFLRKRLNLSQEELANRVGLNRGNIASYENGTAEPRICNLLKLSNLFGVSIMDITQRDLSNDHSYQQASESFQQWSKTEEEVLHRFAKKADEIKKVISSIHTCHQYKAKSMNEMPKDLQIAMMNFEQLHDATQALICHHQALLEFVKCRLPNKA